MPRASIVIFWLALVLPGRPPIVVEMRVDSPEACITGERKALLRTALMRAGDGALLHGGEVRVGCTVRFAPSMEN